MGAGQTPAARALPASPSFSTLALRQGECGRVGVCASRSPRGRDRTVRLAGRVVPRLHEGGSFHILCHTHTAHACACTRTRSHARMHMPRVRGSLRELTLCWAPSAEVSSVQRGAVWEESVCRLLRADPQPGSREASKVSSVFM